MARLWIFLYVFCATSPAAEYGLASWYGGAFDGRMAASGEIFHDDQLTAAHRILPFGTRVLVRRADKNRSVVVRINDRGPFVESRIIDLSEAAARELGMVEPGVVPVSLEVMDIAVAPPPGSLAVQVGAFRVQDNARRAREAMERLYGAARIVHRERDGDLWCVVVGEAATEGEAASLVEDVRKRSGTTGAFVVRVDGASESPAPPGL